MAALDTVTVGVSETSPLLQTDAPQSCFGRVWEWVKPRKEIVTRAALGTASAITASTLTYFAVSHFKENLLHVGTSVLQGAGLGISSTILTGSLLPSTISNTLFDFAARWSYDGLTILSQFYETAGCPITTHGFWNSTGPSLAIQEVGALGTSAIAAAVFLLSMRTLFHREESQDEIESETKPIGLLESRTDEIGRLIGEQGVKALLGTTLLLLQKNKTLISAPEWAYLGYFLLNSITGVVVAKSALALKEKCFPAISSQTNAMRTMQKVARIAEMVTFGALFILEDTPSFLLSGFVSGAAKMLHLYSFERLKSNTETVPPFTIMRVDNIAKGFFLALGLVWYASKLANVDATATNYINTASYLALAVTSYVMTRELGRRFTPGENGRLFNTFRFYFVHFQEFLVLPYMLIRSAEYIHEALPDEGYFGHARNFAAIASLGLATGNNRALMSMRSNKSPTEVSDLALTISWFLLANGGSLS